ncbi:MAG: tRNA (adenosine(37)-N6)-threonylcarbamoyltransferase complex ATPase subunit type 1 TsaE [Gammaproteobacteria bacterium]|nr:tRNA (adenosine(37)-N6)-threonylcarbamoyltransferase complex ATPase subunit type 1 TsaE [Gammaproteobacteria bacterium]
MSQPSHFIIESETAMEAFGAKLALSCKPGDCLVLNGPLGAGKTTLVRGFLKGLGHKGIVKSPTYTLVETYNLNNQAINHFDLYRIAEPEELEFIGWRDYFNDQAINLVEWPEKAGNFMPSPTLIIDIEILADDKRELMISSRSSH